MLNIDGVLNELQRLAAKNLALFPKAMRVYGVGNGGGDGAVVDVVAVGVMWL